MSTRSLGHRQVVVDLPHVGDRLAQGFEELGWKVDRHVVMVHRRPPDRPIDTGEVEILEEAKVWPARDRFLRTYEWCDNDDITAQMHGTYRTWIRAGSGEDLGIVRDGTAASFAMLWVHDRSAQIEDVATIQAFRDQGLSRAVVTRAVERAHERGCDFVFLVADEGDWPKELYRKLGFDPVGTLYYFLKTNS